MIVKFFATFRRLTGESSCRIDSSPATAGELLRELSRRYGPTFEAAVFDDQRLSETVIILVNGRNLIHTGGLDTPVSAGDEVSVFPMVAGG
jgi:molybdopterin synthase sulfur carrier subunit